MTIYIVNNCDAYRSSDSMSVNDIEIVSDNPEIIGAKISEILQDTADQYDNLDDIDIDDHMDIFNRAINQEFDYINITEMTMI